MTATNDLPCPSEGGGMNPYAPHPRGTAKAVKTAPAVRGVEVGSYAVCPSAVEGVEVGSTLIFIELLSNLRDIAGCYPGLAKFPITEKG